MTGATVVRFYALGKDVRGFSYEPEVSPPVPQLGDVDTGEAPARETRCSSARVMQAKQVHTGDRAAN